MFRMSAFLFLILILLVIAYLWMAYFCSKPMAEWMDRYCKGFSRKHRQTEKQKNTANPR